jgi:uncharacterized protein YfeS
VVVDVFALMESEVMDNLHVVIKHMTSDSRMISLNTGFPQYRIEQIKTQMFLSNEDQTRETCEWWLRLYHGEYTKADKNRLEDLI